MCLDPRAYWMTGSLAGRKSEKEEGTDHREAAWEIALCPGCSRKLLHGFKLGSNVILFMLWNNLMESWEGQERRLRVLGCKTCISVTNSRMWNFIHYIDNLLFSSHCYKSSNGNEILSLYSFLLKIEKSVFVFQSGTPICFISMLSPVYCLYLTIHVLLLRLLEQN